MDSVAARLRHPPQSPTTLLVKFFLDHFSQLLNLSLATGWFLPHLVVQVGPVVAGLEHKGRRNIEDLLHILSVRRGEGSLCDCTVYRYMWYTQIDSYVAVQVHIRWAPFW